MGTGRLIGSSLTELTGALGIAPASFYFVFGSKEALFRRVVERCIMFQAKAFERAFHASTTGAGVKALLRGYVDVVTDPEHAPGCLVVKQLALQRCRRCAVAMALGTSVGASDQAGRSTFRGGKLPDELDPKTTPRFVMTLAVALPSGPNRERGGRSCMP